MLVVRNGSGTRHNAWLLGEDGHVVAAEHVGDHVSQVRATPNGDIWVGYTDQGVFGYGPASDLSGHGLVRYSPTLKPVWRFPQDSATYPIDDCEGINLTGDTVWLCTYGQHPVMRISTGQVTTWANRKVQANIGVLLVDEGAASLALVAPAWSRERGLTRTGHLTATDFEPNGSFHLRRPDGDPISAESQVSARGPDLHVIDGLDWYRADLGDFA